MTEQRPKKKIKVYRSNERKEQQGREFQMHDLLNPLTTFMMDENAALGIQSDKQRRRIQHLENLVYRYEYTLRATHNKLSTAYQHLITLGDTLHNHGHGVPSSTVDLLEDNGHGAQTNQWAIDIEDVDETDLGTP